MQNLDVPIRPVAYFRDYANGNRVSSNDRPMVKLTKTLDALTTIAQVGIPGDRHSKEHILSLALEYGISRPEIDWGYSIDEFAEIAMLTTLAKGEKLEEPVLFPEPLTRYRERQKLPTVYHIRMESQTREKLSIYTDFLGCSQSVAIRHFVALAFRWYSSEIYANKRLKRYNSDTQEYVNRLRGHIEARIKYAEETLKPLGIEPL